MVDWLVVNAVSGLGPARIQQLLSHMDVSELRQYIEHDPSGLPMPEGLLSQQFSGKKFRSDPNLVANALAWQDSQSEHHIITLDDPLYPPLLKNIVAPPPILFVIGQLTSLLPPSIAIVGSRAASKMGIKTSYELAQQISTMGFLVTSGLAAGIDGAAHQACVDRDMPTVAVLGTGVDVIYPKRHRCLYQDIPEHGALISEFWPGTKPYAGNFPKRNRIISGLSLGTLVVEANRKSGSLITAQLAIEQGREVFAVPGSIVAGYNQGCHDLIKNGAKLVESAVDIMDEVAILSGVHLEMLSNSHHIEGSRTTNLPFDSLLASVGYEATTIDDVVEHSGKTIELVLEQLLELELQGWVTAVPGGYIRIKRS